MRYGAPFGPQAIRILDTIKRAGRGGIDYDELFERTYSDRPSKRTALKGQILQINKKLEASCRVQISGRGGKYHLTTLQAKRMLG
jgi:hypothetical protein